MNHTASDYQQGELTADRFAPGTLPDVFQLVERSAAALKGVQRRTVGRAGLTPAQYVVMGALWEHDELPLKDLAAEAFCTPAAITGIIDVLERKGLVTRRPNPRDRRSLLATLTAAGRALRSEVPTPGEILGDCCSVLSPEETNQLAALLRRLDEAIATWEVE